MTREYPRNYLIVEDGKIEKIEVRDAVQELAIVLQHSEATGLNRPEPFDHSRFVITEDGEGE